jgi:hypothetical protein
MAAPTSESFTIHVPPEDHDPLADAIEDQAADHATLNADRRSGHSKNSDATEITFSAATDGTVTVIVTANPKKLPLAAIKRKAEHRVKELLAA